MILQTSLLQVHATGQAQMHTTWQLQRQRIGDFEEWLNVASNISAIAGMQPC